MIVWSPAPRAGEDALPKGNPADLLYLEEAVAALSRIMPVCADAGRSSRADVRALARVALSVQADRLTAVSTLLHEWGRPNGLGRAATGDVALDGLDEEVLDRAFVDRLTAYIHVSTVRSRAELIVGASRATRQMAEHAIHEDDRQLGRVRDFLRLQAQQGGALGVDDALSRWGDDGGSWHGASAPIPSEDTGARRWPT